MDLGRHSIVEWAEAAPEESAAAFVPSEDKFVVESSIGRGGMGEVFLVSDKDLRRQVAMKVLRPDLGPGREARLHFVAEAQATSQLEHPCIPPVHDIGVTGDGRPYFTMKLVRGRTLGDVLHDLVIKRREVQREYTLHRLVTILERIAETLHFSHERGVIHRDIKPENIMLGDYALGCVLYEVLALHPAFDPHDKGVLARVQAGDCPDLETRDEKRAVPAPLAAICRKAMAPLRDDRHESARELACVLRAWLDGTSEKKRRHEEAEKLVVKGRADAMHYEMLKGLAAEAEAEAEAEAARCESRQPVAEKQLLLAARRSADALRVRAAQAFAETTHSLNAALVVEKQNDTALRALADLWKDRLIEAERYGNREEAAHALTMTRRYSLRLRDPDMSGRPQIHHGDLPPLSEHAENMDAYSHGLGVFLRGNGSLSLMTEPSGADVRVYRYRAGEQTH